MTRKTEQHRRFHPRKEPRQSRSRSTVDAIKQAAREMITTAGFSSSISTTLIAERAGVNIGSLYQYFPSREVIFLSLFEDTSALMTETMKGVMVRVLGEPLDRAVPIVLRKLLELHREHEPVMLKMMLQIPELKLATQPLSFDNMILDATRIAVNRWNPGLSKRELNRRAFFLHEIILGCIQRYLITPPEDVTDRSFVNDLTQIVIYYVSLPANNRLRRLDPREPKHAI